MTAPDRLSEVLARLTPEAGLDVRLAERNETPLIWAVSEGYHDLAVTLIEAGADLDAQNSDGNTALLRAACEGRTELARLLIRVGAELDVQNRDGYSALILAQRRGNAAIVDALRAAGADPSLVTALGTTVEDPGHSPKASLQGRRDPTLEQQIVDAIETCHAGGRKQDKRIHLVAEDRFLPTDVLRRAYVRYDNSRSPDAPPYVALEDGLELGIATSAVPEVARAVSSLLSRSLEDARNDRGGYLPPAVVQRVQREIISPWGVAYLWGITGHRFVLSRPAPGDRRELVATILVGRSKDTVFFFTGRYNNLRHSTIRETVDFEQADAPGSPHRWFERFAFPPVERFKPAGYHHIANFVVAKEHRRKRLSRRLLDAIVEHYALSSLEAAGRAPAHCQHLLCGKGFWLIGDPPWFARMQRLGFSMRWGAESFFLEHDWAPLPPVHDPESGAPISNVDYNRAYDLPQRYLDQAPPEPAGEHLLERVPEVVRLAQDPRAKLQYTQTLFEFPC
ncbi:MAG: ankyrin repeat domain-containing protein [Planctomycetota bacterium]